MLKCEFWKKKKGSNYGQIKKNIIRVKFSFNSQGKIKKFLKALYVISENVAGWVLPWEFIWPI